MVCLPSKLEVICRFLGRFFCRFQAFPSHRLKPHFSQDCDMNPSAAARQLVAQQTGTGGYEGEGRQSYPNKFRPILGKESSFHICFPYFDIILLFLYRMRMMFPYFDISSICKMMYIMIFQVFPYVFHMFPPKKPADLPGKPRPAPPPPVPPVPARPRPERMSRLSPRKKKDGTGRKGKDARILQMFLFKVLLLGIFLKGISRNLYLDLFAVFFLHSLLGIYKGICRESNALFVLQIFF